MSEKGGKPRTFKNKYEVMGLYQEFCDEIVNGGYHIAPTQTEFAKWVADKKGGCDRRTVYLAINKYYPEIKNEFESMRADVVAMGTMLGAYNASMSIFALKNWCGWTDKREVKSEQTVSLSDAVIAVEELVTGDA